MRVGFLALLASLVFVAAATLVNADSGLVVPATQTPGVGNTGVFQNCGYVEIDSQCLSGGVQGGLPVSCPGPLPCSEEIHLDPRNVGPFFVPTCFDYNPSAETNVCVLVSQTTMNTGPIGGEVVCAVGSFCLPLPSEPSLPLPWVEGSVFIELTAACGTAPACNAQATIP
jgi:hypothetical protein